MSRLTAVLSIAITIAASSGVSAADVPEAVGQQPLPLLVPPATVSSVAYTAQEVPPVPAPAGSIEPVADPVVTTSAITLYDCVKYRDLRKIAPCAVPKIVSVIDPCHHKKDCCEPKCVYVQICVPPCDCPCVKVTRNGRRVRYDYGKYRVTLTSTRRGVVIVNYDG